MRALAGFLTLLAIGLSGCGGGRRTEELLEQLRSPDAASRLHAVQALADRHAKGSAAVAALAEALRDVDPFVRRDAARALGHVGTAAESAVPALHVAARDQNPQVRKAVSEALRKIRPGQLSNAGTG
jgi:HEAT repeat protein